VPSFQVAHFREQGQDIIVILVNSSFWNQTADDQNAAMSELQLRANSAGLSGTVVPVWESGGRMHFKAPTHWHPFFRSLSMPVIAQNINRTLTW
jgi:hypothetical protein